MTSQVSLANNHTTLTSRELIHCDFEEMKPCCVRYFEQKPKIVGFYLKPVWA